MLLGATFRSTASTPSGTADGRATPTAKLPADWQPWQVSLRKKTTGDPADSFDSGCLPGGSAMYCAGTGFTTAKVGPASGRILWTAGTSPQSTLPVGVRDGIVYTYAGQDSTTGTSNRQLLALDADSGKRRWTLPAHQERPAYLFNRGVLMMSQNGRQFVAYDASGRRLWAAPTNASDGDDCEPLVLEDAPYGQCPPDADRGTTGFIQFDPADGTRRDLAELPPTAVPLGDVQGQPLFAEQKKRQQSLFGADQPYKTLLRVDPGSGAVARVPLPDLTRGTPALLDGVVYFVRPNGRVTAVRAVDGKQLWQSSTDIESMSSPVVSAKYNALYFINMYGRLLALDLDTGAELWRTPSVDDPGSSVEDVMPSLSLVDDAIVAVVGETAFSVRPDRPTDQFS